MNWEMTGAIAEVTGACVVLVSLIYIALQLRDAKVATNRATRLERNNALSRTVLNTPGLADILAKISEVDGSHEFVKEMQTTYNLSSAEAELYLRYLATTWRTLETDSLTLNDGAYIRTPIGAQLRIPSSKKFIEIQGRRYDERFIKIVNEVKNGS